MNDEAEDVMQMLRTTLTQRRKELKLSQVAVAEAMGASHGQGWISDLETGVRAKPTLETLMRWAAALRVSIRMQLNFEHVGVAAYNQTVTMTVVEYEVEQQ